MEINERDSILIDTENINLLKQLDFTFDKIPPQSVVQRILREMYNINIHINFKPNVKKFEFISYPMSLNGKEFTKLYFSLDSRQKFETYEEALEHGITESLKTLLKKE